MKENWLHRHIGALQLPICSISAVPLLAGRGPFKLLFWERLKATDFVGNKGKTRSTNIGIHIIRYTENIHFFFILTYFICFFQKCL